MTSKNFTISEAKFRILNKNPFFGTLLFNLPVVEVTDPEELKQLPTLGVDGERLYVNMHYWNSLSKAEQMAVLMHEAGHLFLGHCWRGRNKQEIVADPTTGQMFSLYNLAGDYVINLMIDSDQEKRFKLPGKCPLDRKYDGWSTDEVYADLLKTIPQMTQQQAQDFAEKHGGFCSKQRWGKDGNGKERSRQENGELQKKWEQVAKQAAEIAKERGFEPAYVKRLFDLYEPKEDWRNLLREYVESFQNDYSFNPVDRRYLEEDFTLPDVADGEKIDWVAVAIDTSGSISKKELDHFVSELKGIMEGFDKVKVKLTFCDAEASPFTELEEFDTTKIKPTGGGGTDFRPVFDLVKKEVSEPKVLLYFTDLEGSFPSHPPEYDTIWLNTVVRNKAPFGKTLPYNV